MGSETSRQMRDKDRTIIRRWLWAGAALIMLLLAVGGITRLTDSGLSITEWEPIMGAVPPLNDAQWQEAFDKYKDYPEYQQLNKGMDLSEFKFIFFWEYLHRLLGRLMGIVFIVPFAFFWWKGMLDRKWISRLLMLFGLGFLQGLMGWFMVASGLVDIPYVSHYRLAIHLVLAFLLFGLCVWYAMDLYNWSFLKQWPDRDRIQPELKKWTVGIVSLLTLQVIWGAFVAGTHAGHVYNTFPTMNQFWIPPESWSLEPLLLNFVENQAAIQFMHRLLGTLLLIAVVGMWSRIIFRSVPPAVRNWGLALFAITLLQYLLGVFTLLTHVPIPLGVLHQVTALIMLAAILALYYIITNKQWEKRMQMTRN